jgi:hypothetical protein
MEQYFSFLAAYKKGLKRMGDQLPHKHCDWSGMGPGVRSYQGSLVVL